MAREIAADGYLVVIVPMPLRLAFFGLGRAGQVMESYPYVDHWAIGGHSLGGAMASRYAYEHLSDVDGLVLWASYPADSDDLSNSSLAVLSVYGTLDGLATVADIEASRPLLPPSTLWVPVEGGNHAQFGWYGDQGGDNAADVSRLEQQTTIVEATLRVLVQIDNLTP